MNLRYYLSVVKWNSIYYFRYFYDSSFRSLMNSNKAFFHSHRGERCFVVGNAPSIKEMDLSHLENEYVFTVNDICSSPDIYKKLSSNCHVFVDPYYCGYSKERANVFVEQATRFNKDIQLFTIIEGKSLFSRRMCGKLNYLFMHHIWNKKPSAIDLSKNLYIAQNVVQGAIYIALYMGFKEIYLIGCDMTSFIETMNYNATRNFISYHAYDIDDEDKKALDKNKKIRDNAYMLKDYYITFEIFKKIKEFADEKSIRIINSTKNGLLDMYPRKDYESLFIDNENM